jgi:hypothetical protein
VKAYGRNGAVKPGAAFPRYHVLTFSRYHIPALPTAGANPATDYERDDERDYE